MASNCRLTKTKGVSRLHADVVGHRRAEGSNLTHSDLDVGTNRLTIDLNVVVLDGETTIGSRSTPAHDDL